MHTETQACFEVFGFGEDPGSVSAIMGMKPTKAWVKGDRYDVGSRSAIRTHSRWSLCSGLDERDAIEAHLAALLAVLEPKQDQVRQVMQSFPAQIGVAQYIYEANPQFQLEPEILRRLGGLGIPVYFDQYCLGEDDGG